MKKKIFYSKRNTQNQKLLYLILIGLALLALIIGIIFIFTISKGNQETIKEAINTYYKESSLTLSSFFRVLFNNYTYILLIWILGISVIGIPIVLAMFLFKSFLLGFSLSSIFYTFKFKGILVTIFNLIPSKLLFLIVLLLITFYSISFSVKLYKHLFLRKPINFRDSMNKYLKVLLISLVVTIFISLFESFISIYLLNLFNI